MRSDALAVDGMTNYDISRSNFALYTEPRLVKLLLLYGPHKYAKLLQRRRYPHWASKHPHHRRDFHSLTSRTEPIVEHYGDSEAKNFIRKGEGQLARTPDL